MFVGGGGGGVCVCVCVMGKTLSLHPLTNEENFGAVLLFFFNYYLKPYPPTKIVNDIFLLFLLGNQSRTLFSCSFF